MVHCLVEAIFEGAVEFYRSLKRTFSAGNIHLDGVQGTLVVYLGLWDDDLILAGVMDSQSWYLIILRGLEYDVLIEILLPCHS